MTASSGSPRSPADHAAAQGVRALRRRQRHAARRWAFRALNLDPEHEGGWLLLAALAAQPARRGYLEHLLEIHPNSERGLRALHELSPHKAPTPPTGPLLPISEHIAYRTAAPQLPQTAPPKPLGPPLPTRAPAKAPEPVPIVVWPPRAPMIRRALGSLFKRLVAMAGTLLGIAFLTIFGLGMAERGRQGLPTDVLNSAGQAVAQTAAYLYAHPLTYLWHHTQQPAFKLVGDTFINSAALLLAALGLAVLIGVPLGMAAAIGKRRAGTVLALLVSILGISTPSFLLAMFLWVVNIQMHRTFNIAVLPTVGFGFDAHMVMPALVLAARPLAQVAQITYVSLAEVLQTDYVRTARAKGLLRRLVYFRHAFRNLWIPILTTLGTSLRFSLASLPVVEYFFNWPGVGSTLLEAIQLGSAPLVADLIVSLGLFFLIINQVLEWVFPLLNPKLRDTGETEQRRAESGLAHLLADSVGDMKSSIGDLVRWVRRQRQPLPPFLPAEGDGAPGEAGTSSDASSRWPSRRRIVAAILNPPLIVGGAMAVGLIALVIFGPSWTTANPYETHGVMMVEGVIGSPPYHPSSVFPWGTDELGRDIQALVLAGARQTLTLAFFATLARVLLGSLLGILAGWMQGTWFDSLVTGAMGVWAAFPVTLFAMILIQALGIEQGMWVFVVALSVVGWGEVAQLMRSRVIEIKPTLFVDAARSLGARSTHILRRHIIPNLVSPLMVVSVLEMGGVLMLLAELGFLNIFLGGGYQAMIGTAGRMVPIIVHFSDVPEWGALLANIREWWRAYPWMAWYPGLAFFLSIMTFNLFGEGIRRWVDQSQFDLSRLVNRTTVLLGIGVTILLAIWMRSTSPISVYKPTAASFDTQQAMAHIQALSAPAMGGRETGTPGARQAADYIAQQMEAIGLGRAGDGNSFIQTLPHPRQHIVGVPELSILNPSGGVLENLKYRDQFVELPGDVLGTVTATGPIVGVVLGPDPGTGQKDPYGLGNYDLYDKIILVRQSDLPMINVGAAAGVLVVSDDPLALQRHFAIPERSLIAYRGRVIMMVSRDVANGLLISSGSSLDEFESMGEGLPPGEIAMTEPGATVRMSMTTESYDSVTSEDYYNVIGFLPGTGSSFSQAGGGLDSHVIMVTAYYDGVGTAPDGVIYPGANDNASGVAAMLELARALKNSPYQPKRTVVFAAWAGGERREGLSVDTIMNAHLGFNELTVDAVMELSGVAGGSGQAIAIGQETSYRLVQLFQQAAGALGYKTTTRGRGPHYGIPTSAGFGGREALPISLSWDGSDTLAHTPGDSIQAIDPMKLQAVGRSALLTLTVLTREPNY